MEDSKIKSTHVVFDGEKVVISPNLVSTFKFLIHISQEIDELLGFASKISSISKKLECIMGDLSNITKILQEKGIEYNFSITKETLSIVDDLSSNQIERSQMICLFAFMETIFCLVTIYNHETIDEKKIITYNNNDILKLINYFLLSDDNKYYKENKNRFCKISANKLKRLRNNLTHFYSVCNIGIVPDSQIEKAIEIENKLQKEGHGSDCIFISPINFHEMLKSAIGLLLKDWNNATISDYETFVRKIGYVITVVESNAAVIVEMKK